MRARTFQDRGDAHTPDGTDRNQPALAALSMQQLAQYRQYARAGSGKGMAKGNARAFDVKLDRSIAPSAVAPEPRAAILFRFHAFSVASTCAAKAS